MRFQPQFSFSRNVTEIKFQRLFVALWPNHTIRLALSDVQNQLNLEQLGRPTPVKNFHMTLLFLGDIPNVEVQEIKTLIEEFQFEPFSMEINRIGYWPYNNILWAGPDHIEAELLDLSKKIRRVLRRYVSERRKFIPHVTLARKIPRRVHMTIEPIPWHVRSLCLVQSNLTHEGAQYQLITRSKITSQDKQEN